MKRGAVKNRVPVGLGRLRFVILATVLVTGGGGSLFAQDIREAARQAEERIFGDRQTLAAEVAALEAQQRALEASIADLEGRETAGQQSRSDLEEEWSRRELEFREISGNIRVVARDLESLLKSSPLSAQRTGRPDRLEPLAPLLRTGYFPDIEDVTTMAGLFFDEIARSGQVSRHEGVIVGRDGTDAEAEIFQLGPFTAFYRTAGETGFLNYSTEGQRFFALAALPSRGLQGRLRAYAAGESETAPVDISGGAALRQVTHRTSLMEQLRAGGPIVWPILLLALIAVAIVVYKIVFLNRVHGNIDRIMGQVNELAARRDWSGCEQIISEHRGKNWPVVHVIRAGLGARDRSREVLESVLQEAILHQLPRVQRGLAILAILGAVAPLLGLLGTVTGMIDTFRVITLFGTSDPKLMSGGISEALVTTELGLAVAIPIMLLHTFLSRRTDHIISDMEEQAVHLTNILQGEAEEAVGA